MGVTLWSIRLASVAYALAVALLLGGRWRAFRIAWTLGLLLYLCHVAAAFHYHHQWSHIAAWRETARQTEELFGAYWGGGLYFNYLFTLVWAMDAIWAWLDEAGYRARRRAVSWAVHGFLAFLFFHGTVVFASGWTRWSGLVATLVLLILFSRRR